ncbi:MAG: helix-turn-helix transcriptional regulator [Clostridia bacterium]|nr:helix-turn-helix transcriptional regulator [Clostridia bacterium]
MIQTYTFSKDENDREIMENMTQEFPVICKTTTSGIVGTFVPWHWHSAFEIDVVTKGTAMYETPGRTYTVHAGEALFLNENVLHRTLFPDKTQENEQFTLLFFEELLSGAPHSVFARRYVRPVAEDERILGEVIRPADDKGGKSIDTLLRIRELFRREPYGYELSVRSLLSGIWLELCERLHENEGGERESNPYKNKKIKTMLELIHTHYSERLTLERLAAEANISTRECSRAFRENLHVSAMEYVSAYRISVAEKQLIETEKSIEDVAADCGFSSTSYFIKKFRNATAQSPLQFRKENAASVRAQAARLSEI